MDAGGAQDAGVSVDAGPSALVDSARLDAHDVPDAGAQGQDAGDAAAHVDAGAGACDVPIDAPTCTIFVSTTGSDSAAGTRDAPLATPAFAVSRATAGDTICVDDGVYVGTVRFSRSGAEGMPITLRNVPGRHPVIESGSEETAHGILLQAAEGHDHPIGWIVIQGLEIRASTDGIKIYGTHDLVVRGNRIHDNGDQGIFGNGTRILVDGNAMWGNGPDASSSNLEHGMYVTGSHWTVVNNVIYGNTAYGVQIAGYPFEAGYHPGPEYAGAADWLVSNNTFGPNDNRGAIVLWQPDATRITIQNNIFYRATGGHAIGFVTPGGGHVFRNNLVFDGVLTNGTSDLYIEAGTVSGDPLLVDEAARDYHLRAASPAIDRGTDERAPMRDSDGVTRPVGAHVDIGAFERCE